MSITLLPELVLRHGTRTIEMVREMTGSNWRTA